MDLERQQGEVGDAERSQREPTRAEQSLGSLELLRPVLRSYRYFVDVLYEDTDVTGAVYHVNYLKFVDRARGRLLSPRLLRSIQCRHGTGFVIHKASLDFKAPATFGDRLRIDTRVRLSTFHKLDFVHDLHNDESGKLVVVAHVRAVCVGANGTPLPIPLREVLEAMQLGGEP